MKAGGGVRLLAFPEDFFPTEGFGSVLDPLYARVLVLEKEKRFALCVLDMTSIPPNEIKAINTVLQETTDADQTWVLASHTFSAPHFLPDHMLKTAAEKEKKECLQQLVRKAVREAAADAAAHLQPVTVSFGKANCMVNTARDVETPDGWWMLNNGDGPVDHTMSVIRFDRQDGKPAAVMFHYAVQSSVLDGSVFSNGKAVSGDLAGRLAAAMERDLGCPVLFLIGAAGDQAPREKAVGFVWERGEMVRTDLGEAILPSLDAMAGEMISAAMEACAAAKVMDADTLLTAEAMVILPAKQMERDLRKLRPTRIPPYVPDGKDTQPVTLLQIGDVRLIGVKPELNCITASEISGGDPTIRVVTLWNGGAKYMADEASCERITYESQNSPFMPGAAEKLVRTAKDMLKN